MNNCLLSKDALDVLASIPNWRIFASGLENDIAGEPDPRHIEWMRTHGRLHPNQEMLFVLSGETYFGYTGTCYRTEPGDVFLIDKFEDHDDFYPTWTPDFEHLWIIFLNDKALARVVTRRHGKYIEGQTLLLPMHTTTHWQNNLFSYKKCPHLMPTVRKLRVYAEIATVLASIIQAGYSEPDNDDESFQEKIIASVEEYIIEVGGAGMRVDTLAKISGYSRFHLERLFKKRTGKNLRQFIKECKIESVHRLIASGYNKKEVANALGFSCPSAFSRWCRNNIDRS